MSLKKKMHKKIHWQQQSMLIKIVKKNLHGFIITYLHCFMRVKKIPLTTTKHAYNNL